MLIRVKICGDHCDRKTQSVNALLSHISKCREILFFHMFTDLLMIMCARICACGMIVEWQRKHVMVAFLSKWHSADLPLKIHNNSFLHFLAQWQGYQKSYISPKRLSFALIKVDKGTRMLWRHTTLCKGWGYVQCHPFDINKISSMLLQTFFALTSTWHVQ